MRIRTPAWALILAGWTLTAAVARAQLVSENGGTTSPETPQVRFRIQSAVWQNASEHGVVTEAHYAPIAGLEFSAGVPVLRKEIRIGEEREERSGTGDAWVGGKYVLWKQDGTMTSDRLAVFASLELPTGEWRDELDGAAEPYARKLQLGSGTWDGTLGVAATVIRDRHRLAANLSGRASSGRDGVRPGGFARFDVSYWFRLVPSSFEPGESGLELRPVIEVSAVRHSRTRGEDADDRGWRVWISPGLQFYLTESLLLEGGVSLPLYDSVDDPFGDSRFTAFAGFKLHF
jgi:hypothetical protein